MGPPAPPRVRPSASEFDDRFKSMGDLQINGSDLSAIKRYLDLINEMTARLARMSSDAHEVAKTDAGSLGASTVEGVDVVRARLSGTADALSQNLTEFAKAVDDTAKAMTVIERDFDSVDKRNELTAQQVHEFLSGRRR